MTRLNLRVLVLSGLIGTVVACGGNARSVGETLPRIQDFYCGGAGTGSPPPSKLILHPGAGIPGRFLVLLMDGVPLHGTAVELAAAHGGTLFDEWQSINGFGVLLPEASAASLAEDERVCFVEQDSVVSGDI